MWRTVADAGNVRPMRSAASWTTATAGRGGSTVAQSALQPVTTWTNGRCLCGAVRYEIDGALGRGRELPLFDVPQASRRCLRDLGGGRRPQDFRFTAGQENIGRYASSTAYHRSFCTTCGSVTPEPEPAGASTSSSRPATSRRTSASTPQVHMFVGLEGAWYRSPTPCRNTRNIRPKSACRPCRASRCRRAQAVAAGSCLCGAAAYEIEAPPHAFHVVPLLALPAGARRGPCDQHVFHRPTFSAGHAARSSVVDFRCRARSFFGWRFAAIAAARCRASRPSATSSTCPRVRSIRSRAIAADSAHIYVDSKAPGIASAATSRSSPKCRRAADGCHELASARSASDLRQFSLYLLPVRRGWAGWGMAAALLVRLGALVVGVLSGWPCTLRRECVDPSGRCACTRSRSRITWKKCAGASTGSGVALRRGAERRRARGAAGRPHRAVARGAARPHAHRGLAADIALPVGRIRRSNARANARGSWNPRRWRWNSKRNSTGVSATTCVSGLYEPGCCANRTLTLRAWGIEEAGDTRAGSGGCCTPPRRCCASLCGACLA